MGLHYEHTWRFTEKRYVALEGEGRLSYRWRRVSIAGLVGVACLFWSYTLLIGIGILLLTTLGGATYRLTGWAARRTYRQLPHLHERTTYGFDDDGVWLSAPSIEARAPWRSLYLWDERSGWLRLNAYGLPAFWFPIAKLKKAGVYEAMMERVEIHAVRFDSPEARWRHGRWDRPQHKTAQ